LARRCARQSAHTWLYFAALIFSFLREASVNIPSEFDIQSRRDLNFSAVLRTTSK
jgi:hypothetical protein